MAQFSNMGPFGPVNVKGGADIPSTPVFYKQLPVTLGGLAGDDTCIFGNFAYRSTVTTSPHVFVSVRPSATTLPVGIFMFDPTIARQDPAMRNRYYAGRPCTVLTFGAYQYKATAALNVVASLGHSVNEITNGNIVSLHSGAGPTPGPADPENQYSRVTEVAGANGLTVWFNFIFPGTVA